MKKKRAQALSAILIILLMIILSIVLYLLYLNWPGNYEEFIVDSQPNAEKTLFSLGATQQFYPGMRFNHNEISYYIENSCPEERSNRMVEAFSTIQDMTQYLSFYPSLSEKADILVGCSEDYIQKEENLFIAGEGGPTEIINTSAYYVINKGKVLLYEESRCDFPAVELHELLHVFGFDHINNPKSIMYNFSSCDQSITPDIIDSLNSLYSYEALPDWSISDVNASKKGRYLDFFIEIRNVGLKDSGDSSLSVLAGENEIDYFELSELAFGAGKIIRIQNLKLPMRNVEEISFVLDIGNKIKELREDNNLVKLKITS